MTVTGAQTWEQIQAERQRRLAMLRAQMTYEQAIALVIEAAEEYLSEYGNDELEIAVQFIKAKLHIE